MGTINLETETIKAYPVLYLTNPGSNSTSVRMYSENAVGAGVNNNEINFYDGPLSGAPPLAFAFLSAVGNAAGARYNGWLSKDDRDGGHLPMRFFTNDASSALKDAFFIQAGTNQGYLGMGHTNPLARIHAKSGLTTEVLCRLQGIASQSGDYLELWDSGGGNIYTFDSNGGYYNKDSATIFTGQQAFSNGKFSTAGDAQMSQLVGRLTTTNNANNELFLDGSATRLTLVANRAFAFNIIIVGRQSTGANSIGQQYYGLLSRATGGNVVLVSQVGNGMNITPPTGWSTTLSADTTNQSLKIQVQGNTGQTVHWVAYIQLVEVI